MTYRREIDGLRAVAVISVIIYHLSLVWNGNPVFSGGFLGVDVFFVISGYLISANLFREMNENRFSFKNFYGKRARRILPAMLFVTLVTVPLAWQIMMPNEFKEYAGSVVASIFSVANFYFLGLDSYTAGPSAYKPLLHIWSLSVEEQYYFIIPAFLLFLWRFQRNHITKWIYGLIGASFLFAIWNSLKFPDSSFFLLPSRFWELFVGAALAYKERYSTFPKSEKLNARMSGLGLFLLLVAMLGLNDKIPHPSYPTLLPIVGTSLIIWFGRTRSFTNNLLSSKAAVGIGLISYSLYLWHQPIFAFTKILTNDLGPKYIKLLEIILSILLAFLTWKYIEKPFRDARSLSRKHFWISIALANACLIGSASYIYIKNGLPERLNSAALQVYDANKGVEFNKLAQNGTVCRGREPANACRFGDSSWVMIGDSHVGVFGPALLKRLEENGHGLMDLTFDQCTLVDDMRFGNMPNCGNINKARWKEINSWVKPKTVLLSANTYLFDTGVSELSGLPVTRDQVISNYRQNIAKLLDLGHRVIIVYPVPNPEFDAQGYLASLAMRSAIISNLEIIYSKNDNAFSNTLNEHKIYDGIADNKNLMRIYPSDIFCPPDDLNHRRCIAITEDGSYYNDGMHLSTIGVNKILDVIFPQANLKWRTN